MTKSELISILADKAGLSKAQADRTLASLAEITTVALQSGQEAVLPGIGKLTTSPRAARTGRNPKTG